MQILKTVFESTRAKRLRNGRDMVNTPWIVTRIFRNRGFISTSSFWIYEDLIHVWSSLQNDQLHCLTQTKTWIWKIEYPVNFYVLRLAGSMHEAQGIDRL